VPKPIRTFRDVDVWQVAMELVVLVYERRHELPAEERFAVAAQIRRSAEGHAFPSRPRANRRHVRIALGSFAELETQIGSATRVNMLTPSSVRDRTNERPTYRP
jgi:four helix bundle protein